MAQRNIPLVPGEYFHIYNRGNSKQKIFLDNKDKDRFVKLLYLSNSTKNINFRDDIIDAKLDVWHFEKGKSLVSIGAWVLMPNHFHIYLISPIPGIGEKEDRNQLNNITKFMNKLSVSYVKYFNQRHERTGSLFEGPFKSKLVKDENQAKYLFSYIHLNPVKLIQKDWKEKGIKNKEYAIRFLREYKYSSYLDYLKINRIEDLILDKKAFPDYFSTKEKLQKEIFEWLSFPLSQG